MTRAARVPVSPFAAVAALLAAAVVGGVIAVAVDELVLETDDGAAARTRAAELVLTASDFGAGWVLDAATDLDGGDSDAGLMGGCATEGVAGLDSGQGSFTALSDAGGNVITSEARLLDSSTAAEQLFDAASSPEAIECMRRIAETEGIERYGVGVPVTAVVEPLAPPAGIDQAAAFRIRVDAGGITGAVVDVYVLRHRRGVAVLELIDPDDPLALATVLTGIGRMVEGLQGEFG